jgi:hypothetical protein
MVHRVFILNSPMFFDEVFEDFREILPKKTQAKFVVSGGSSHTDLEELVEQNSLPSLFGGACKCKATCIYSDKGPWNYMENTYNFAEAETEEDEFKF